MLSKFEEWWNEKGRHIYSYASYLDWYDKRKGLAEAAFNAATAIEERTITSLTAQRAQLIAVASNPDWILAPEGTTYGQHVQAGGQFADMEGGIHASMEDDKDETWLDVIPNPKIAHMEKIFSSALTYHLKENVRKGKDADHKKTEDAGERKAI